MFVFITFFDKANATHTSISFLNIQEITTFFSFLCEVTKTIYKVIGSDEVNRSRNELDFVDYRNWDKVLEVFTAKGEAEVCKLSSIFNKYVCSSKVVLGGINSHFEYLEKLCNGELNKALKIVLINK